MTAAAGSIYVGWLWLWRVKKERFGLGSGFWGSEFNGGNAVVAGLFLFSVSVAIQYIGILRIGIGIRHWHWHGIGINNWL